MSMTATEELRRLLDERGVYYVPSSWASENETYWRNTSHKPVIAVELGDGRFRLDYECYLTAEEVIEATLGRTCHVKAEHRIGDSFGFLLSCGHSMVNPFDDHPDYCPWCGARILVPSSNLLGHEEWR